VSAESQRLQESLKLEFEWHKHLTTLSASLIVGIATVVEAFFSGAHNPFEDVWILLSLGFLLLALLLSLISMSLTLRYIRLGTKPGLWFRTMTWIYAFFLFFSGLISFAIFALTQSTVIPL
jgi:hypothetical protein